MRIPERRGIVARSCHIQGFPEADVWLPDDDALKHIIHAVGAKYTCKLDCDRLRNQLASDLLEARSKWLLFTALDSDKGARARAKLFGAIADSAKNFNRRLRDARGQEYAARAIASKFDSVADFDAFLVGLDRTIEAAEALTGENRKGGSVRLGRPLKEWFAAEILPPIFERNFGRSAAVSRSADGSGLAGGPFIRFVRAVMREMSIPISAETVARALKDVRAGRERRTRRPTTLPRPAGW
jgi:hypothetical protein